MEFKVFGKWILAGEHAVLRGCPALVFPLKGKSLDVQYLKNDYDFEIEFSGDYGSELKLVIWGILEKAFELLKIKRSDVKGRLKLKNDIPIGAGLGASAVLSVAMGRFLIAQNFLEENKLYEFSKSIEDLFHGESSGVDVAVAIHGQGLEFLRQSGVTKLNPIWTPKCYVSYSGKRGTTIECVNQVKALFKESPKRAEAIDTEMREAVALCKEALCNRSQIEGLPILSEGIQMASECFLRWGLIPNVLESHMNWLKKEGALAVKPTGSGDGGFVLSLWNREPSKELNLIKCF